MKLSKYIPEIICLLLFTHFSSLWVISLKEDKANSAQLSPLSALEKLIPQHEVQLLNANFSDQLHYDQLAQLQSEVEALIFEANFSDDSEQLLKDYKETSLSYTQLTSMLKTSQRLISENSRFENTQLESTQLESTQLESTQLESAQLENTQLTQVIDNIRLNMFSFISSPNNTDKAALTELLNSIDVSSRQQVNWQHLQLVKLHSLFVLDNYELTATYRQKLIGMPVVEAISQERALLQQQIRQTTIKQFIGIFGAIFALLALFIVVIKHHQNALKKTSEQHKEFATNLMDMLGPNIEKVQTKRTHDDGHRGKPVGRRRRK